MAESGRLPIVKFHQEANKHLKVEVLVIKDKLHFLLTSPTYHIGEKLYSTSAHSCKNNSDTEMVGAENGQRLTGTKRDDIILTMWM